METHKHHETMNHLNFSSILALSYVDLTCYSYQSIENCFFISNDRIIAIGPHSVQMFNNPPYTQRPVRYIF